MLEIRAGSLSHLAALLLDFVLTAILCVLVLHCEPVCRLGQAQKREQKPTTKTFVGFHNHSLY